MCFYSGGHPFFFTSTFVFPFSPESEPQTTHLPSPHAPPDLFQLPLFYTTSCASHSSVFIDIFGGRCLVFDLSLFRFFSRPGAYYTVWCLLSRMITFVFLRCSAGDLVFFFLVRTPHFSSLFPSNPLFWECARVEKPRILRARALRLCLVSHEPGTIVFVPIRWTPPTVPSFPQPFAITSTVVDIFFRFPLSGPVGPGIPSSFRVPTSDADTQLWCSPEPCIVLCTHPPRIPTFSTTPLPDESGRPFPIIKRALFKYYCTPRNTQHFPLPTYSVLPCLSFFP